MHTMHLSMQSQHDRVKLQHCNVQYHEQQRRARKHPPMAEVVSKCPISRHANVATLQPQNMLVALVVT